jgi:hypothetical protein
MQLNQLLLDTKKCVDHPIYHPERLLSNHIMLVVLRACIVGGNIDVILAALLHDLMKPQSGMIVNTNDGPYWCNPKHAGHIANLIDENGDIAYFIKNMGGNIKNVSDLCRYHMGVKDSVTKKSRFTPHMDIFPVIDDMVNRKPIYSVIPKLSLPGFGTFTNAEVVFCGMSPIQMKSNNDIKEFTITLGRTPFTFKFYQIPVIVKQFNSDTSNILKILI